MVIDIGIGISCAGRIDLLGGGREGGNVLAALSGVEHSGEFIYSVSVGGSVSKGRTGMGVETESEVGAVVGSAVGSVVGPEVGAVVGPEVGAVVGSAVLVGVGVALGSAVGVKVGVGSGVGFGVGVGVGVGVGGIGHVSPPDST